MCPTCNDVDYFFKVVIHSLGKDFINAVKKRDRSPIINLRAIPLLRNKFYRCREEAVREGASVTAKIGIFE